MSVIDLYLQIRIISSSLLSTSLQRFKITVIILIEIPRLQLRVFKKQIKFHFQRFTIAERHPVNGRFGFHVLPFRFRWMTSLIGCYLASSGRASRRPISGYVSRVSWVRAQVRQDGRGLETSQLAISALSPPAPAPTPREWAGKLACVVNQYLLSLYVNGWVQRNQTNLIVVRRARGRNIYAYKFLNLLKFEPITSTYLSESLVFLLANISIIVSVYLLYSLLQKSIGALELLVIIVIWLLNA